VNPPKTWLFHSIGNAHKNPEVNFNSVNWRVVTKPETMRGVLLLLVLALLPLASSYCNLKTYHV